MGVDIHDLVEPELLELENLGGKRIAVDAFNTLYQFLAIIRQQDGTPLMDNAGNVTSHLSGIFYRNTRLLENGIIPCYVFDGEPPQLKSQTIKERQAIRKDARKQWRSSLDKGDLKEARKYAQQATKLDNAMIRESKELLDALGIPWVQAPSEGESQAAHLCAKGEVWAAGSQDFDSLLFGAPRLIRNLSITGKRKVPGRNMYTTVRTELLDLQKVLAKLEITREQLIEIGILVGTDFNPGIKGIGPKKALKAVLEGTWRDHEFAVDPDEVKKIFLEPEVTDDYTLAWSPPNEEKLIEILHEKHNFSKERIQNALRKLEENAHSRDQKSLDAFF